MAKLYSNIVNGIEKVKQNVRYMKMGMREENKENKRKMVEKNIKRLRDYGHDEMSERMKSEYQRLKKRGTY